MSLTLSQRHLLVFIADYQAKTDGISPTFDEMKTFLGLVSKSSIHRLIEGLVERGFIARLRGRKRAITILKTPDGQDRAISEAITRLYVHGLLTARERDRVRHRFMTSVSLQRNAAG